MVSFCYIHRTGITVNIKSIIMISARNPTRSQSRVYLWANSHLSRSEPLNGNSRVSSILQVWKRQMKEIFSEIWCNSFGCRWLGGVLSVRYQSSWESDWGGKYHHWREKSRKFMKREPYPMEVERLRMASVYLRSEPAKWENGLVQGCVGRRRWAWKSFIRSRTDHQWNQKGDEP